MYDGPDRRKRERFVTNGIDVFIQKTGWRGLFAKPGKVESVDFNQFGIGFDTAQEFGAGDQVQLYVGRTDLGCSVMVQSLTIQN